MCVLVRASKCACLMLTSIPREDIDTPPPLDEPTTPPSPCIPSCPPAYQTVSFVAVASLGPDASPSPPVASPSTRPGTPSSAASDTPPAPSPASALPPPDPSRPFKCLHAACPLWFKRLYTRRVHMATHLPGAGRDRRFACSAPACGMQFSRKHDKLRHEVGNHGMGTQWACAPCNKFFSTQSTLERHCLDKHEALGFTC